ncbi:MlaA family lipoprotein [Pseudoprimorskyibacter insulae]|nr:VacJ family lipoprotein [Pseudoprimorskyibacter insulae]
MTLIGLAACSTPGPGEAPDGIFDPQEQTNRRIHEMNKTIDEKVLRPVGTAIGGGEGGGAMTVVSNFASNLDTPGTIVNQLLQLDFEGAVHNTWRFVVNTTIGLGGLADPATMIGLTEDESDFGETLYVWGFPEGEYMELPVLGPSTERDATGMVVDLFTNPLSYVLPSPEKYVGTGLKAVAKLGKRGRYAELVDGVLYDSADSYAQSRMTYLQNRRYELGDQAMDTYISPDDIDTEGF